MWYNQRIGKFTEARPLLCRLVLHKKSKTPYLRIGQLAGSQRVNIDAREVCTECGQDLGPAWASFNVPVETELAAFYALSPDSGQCLYRK